MFSSPYDVPNYDTIKKSITDYTNITAYPDIEQYFLDKFDAEESRVLFDEIFNTIFDDPNWVNSKLYYLLQAFSDYTKDNLAFEIVNQQNFFDIFFLKQITIDKINNITDPTEKSQQTAYYERFYEIFNNYVSYLSPYLRLIENNSNIQNNLKKDLLIYYGKKIYRARGRNLGFQYLRNILNPISVINKYTLEKINFDIEISTQEWGEFTVLVPEDKKPYIYKLTLQNISDSNIKTSVYSIIKNLIHPSGYKALISDYIQFQINLKLNTTLFLYSTKDFNSSDVWKESTSTGSYILDKSATYGPGYIDLGRTVRYTLNDGETGLVMDFNTPDLNYNLV